MLIFISCFKGYSQYVLHGKVFNSKGNTLSLVKIYDMTTGGYTETNSEGKYEMNFKNKGLYHLLYIAGENRFLKETIEIQNSIQQEDIILRETTRLSEVEITATREQLSNIRYLKDVEGTSIYAGKKTEVARLNYSKPNLSSGTQRQLFAHIAGLNIYENNQASLQLNIGGRGLNPNRTANFNTRQNGYDISADVLGYPESYYTPPPEALREIQFVRGAASLQYGTQFGGLINFKFRTPNKHKGIEVISRQTLGSFGLFGSFNSLSGTIGKFSYYTFLNYKKGDGFRPNSPFSSWNFFGQFNYQFTERTRLSFEATLFDYLAQQSGGMTDAHFYEDIYFSNRQRNWFGVQWYLFNLNLKHKLSEATKLSVNVFGLNASRKSVGFFGNQSSQSSNAITDTDEQDVDGYYVYPRDNVSGRFRNWGAEARLLHKYAIRGKKSIALIGAKYYQSLNSSRQGAGSKNSDSDFHFYNEKYSDYPNQSYFEFPNLNLAFFGENVLYLKENLSITPGFRYDYINTASDGNYRQVLFDLAGNPISNRQQQEQKNFERHIFLLGLGLSYKPHKAIEFYGNISQNYRSITFSDIRTVSPTFKIDSNITDESGYTMDMGVRGKYHYFFSYDVNVFSILYNDRIGIVLDDRANRVRTNVGDAVIYGMESLLQWNFDKILMLPQDYKFRFFTNTSITQSQYYESKITSIKGNQLEFVPFLNFKTGLNLGYENLLGNVQYSLLSNQYTDSTNAPQDKNDTKGGIIGEIPAYGILDVSLLYKYKKVQLEAGVNNLLNEHYFTQRATSYPGPGIIPSLVRNFYVTLGVRL